jgi:hypothetical protein
MCPTVKKNIPAKHQAMPLTNDVAENIKPHLSMSTPAGLSL